LPLGNICERVPDAAVRIVAPVIVPPVASSVPVDDEIARVFVPPEL
jgi:hypothetical protein